METPMKPTVGQIVIYRMHQSEAPINGAHEHPAVVTRVWNDAMVNLHVMFDGRAAEPIGSVSHASVVHPFARAWRWPERVQEAQR